MGFATLAKAKPDGYTIGLLSNAVISHPYLLKGVTFHYKKNYRLIAQIDYSAQGLYAKKGSPYDVPLKELVRMAKEKPDTIKVGIGGTWTAQDFARAIFEEEAGVKFVKVPFPGAGETVPALLGGHVGVEFGPASEWAQLLKGGKVIGLAVGEISRLNQLNFAYIRQREALGLGHALSCAGPFVKEEPFAVLLSDDIIEPGDHLLRDMIALYKELTSPILALEKVPLSEVHKYGVVNGEKMRENVYRINGLVEKPSPSHAPSDMAIIGRYILTADIFPVLEDVEPGKGGEIQLTDALSDLLKKRPIYGYLFTGKRYDAGDKVGYLKATVDFALKNPQVSVQFKEYLIDRVGRLKYA